MLLGRNISRLYGLHRDRISFCLELEETCGTVMNGFFFLHTNDRFCYIIGLVATINPEFRFVFTINLIK